MSLEEIYQQFIENLKQTTILEYIAVVFGIASVWFSRIENILVYPVGLITNIIYVYLSVKFHLIGEATVNFYYTVISIYGWVLWARKDKLRRPTVRITKSTQREWVIHLSFFALIYVIIFISLHFLKKHFTPGALPSADAFASASAFTAMWLMAKKKVESWYWWIATNIVSIPLYFVKGLVVTSIYYLVLLFLAFAGLNEWKRRVTQKAKV